MQLMLPDSLNLHALVPQLGLAVLIVVALLLELGAAPRPGERPAVTVLMPLGLATLLGWLAATPVPSRAVEAFGGMVLDDGLTRATAAVVLIALLLVSFAGYADLERHRIRHVGEYYALLASAGLGMIILAAAGNLIVMFLGLELFSLALYLLCIFFPRETPSQESGMKYFILSSAASSTMLYGMAMLYGATGSTWLGEIAGASVQPSVLLTVGMVLVGSGFAFKLAVVPLHMWAPDVYQGAPTSVTAFMSVATKAAALAALTRLLVGALPGLQIQWMTIFWALAVMSIFLGNLTALAQTSLKRLLAYSGVAHAGYLLMGPLSASEDATRAMMYYLLAYAFMNVGAFLCLVAVEQTHEGEPTLDSIHGLASRDPFLAASLALCLVGLTGLPPTGGFLGKYLLFGEALRAGHFLLVVIGIVGSFVGAYYYLGVVVRMFSPDEAELPPAAPQPWVSLAVAIAVFGVLFTGVWAQPVLDWMGPLSVSFF